MQKLCGSVLKISQKVMHALSKNQPIVALQSTIISHGMPYPQNKQCAFSIQNKISQQGAVPATVAIFDGKIHVGLQDNQIQRLAQSGTKVRKVSRRDLPYIIANKGIGATTVSATMIAAEAAGIDIFVTGGIGGVHRGYEHTMDVSADLDELARTPVTVVSAGVKSILDIQRTLQYLQTKGVPVMTYKSQYFPAFFSASSGLQSPFTVQSQLQAAKIIYSHQLLNLTNGLLVAVPNNNPAQGQSIEKAIQQAIKQSQQKKINGAKITPFLLKRVNQLTEGKSLKSNISLVHNNAQIGGKIAVELAKLKNQAREKLANMKLSIHTNTCSSKNQANNPGSQPCKGKQGNKQHKCSNCGKCGNKQKQSSKGTKPVGKIIAIGCSGIDYHFNAVPGRKFQFHKSCPGTSRISMGGVARNIAQCTNKLGIQTHLISAIGNDPQSNVIRNFCNKNGIKFYPIQPQIKNQHQSTYNLLQNINNSAKYFAIMDQNNNQLIAITQMQINDLLTFQNIYNKYFKYQQHLSQQSKQKITKNDIIVIDSNAPQIQMLKIVKYCAQKFGCLIFFEGKGTKTRKIIKSGAYEYLSVVKINQYEKQQLQKQVRLLPNLEDKDKQKLDINIWLGNNIGKRHSLSNKLKCIITKGSQNGTLIQKNTEKNNNKVQIKTLKVDKLQKVAKTTGAGDTFAGTYLSMLLREKTDQQAFLYARTASKINVSTPLGESAISDSISMENIEKAIKSNIK